MGKLFKWLYKTTKMEYQDDKYLPSDNIREILLRVSPETIINSCGVNKTTLSICKKRNFWSDYINSDSRSESQRQNSFNRLLLKTAEMNEWALFDKLWTEHPGVIPETKTLLAAFEVAFINNNEVMANKIWKKYWNAKSHRHPYRNDILVKREEKKYKLLFTKEINKGYKSKTRLITTNLLELLRDYSDNIDFELSHVSSSYELEQIIKIAKKLEYSINIDMIFQEALINGNFDLVDELLKIYPKLMEKINMAIYSSSSRAIEFLETKGKDIDVIRGRGVRTGNYKNKEIVFTLLSSKKNKERRKEIIKGSFLAFEPRDYIELTIDSFGCVTEHDKKVMIERMTDVGEEYFAFIFDRDVPVCNGEK